MSFPLLPFSVSLIFFFPLKASLSFQAGCDLWQQAAIEEEETVGQERKGMQGESQTDTGHISG